ncbi:AMP-binding protein [Phreatobacter cathodiphilus]|uniref:ATP-dependent acyl-CoA ligase n=1 Tax=Phreatobacter cathodiphilus TaxID=1868589 RepID=A0A2S0NDX5_9HYPH|nr:AMP-binding protein [Phreatobacter cathodiphilus]AVO46141.1 ATP-dependent acyl-CoA ligase [Phreatobacter cathodiphilus]
MTVGGVPDRDSCVLSNLIDRHAAATPDKAFVVLPDGGAVSYARLRAEVRAMARALQDLGVQQGEHVLVWMPNGLDVLRVWFAINYAGAVYVPINTAYRGGILEHVVRNSGARLMIAHGGLAGRLADIDRSALERVVVLGGERPDVPGLDVLGAEALASDGEVKPLSRPVEAWDTQSIIYTSGTTGPSKGVLSSYAHLHAMGTSLAAERDGTPFVGADDRFMVNLPMFHVGGTAPTYAMLACGGSISLLDAFETSTFWQTVEATGTTAVILLGVMASFLMKEPVRPGERDTPLANVIIIPLGAEGVAFRERFGMTTRTLFNMSEVSCPLIAEPNPTVVATCGKPRKGVQLRLVDAHDVEVAPGEIGELVIRTDAPWALNHGYNANPEATAAAWRNGWFHTGDAFRTDADGNYFFVDRFKDAIRRRGENVSSFEVELEVAAHPAVREAAAVAVPSEFGEDDILVAVSLAEGQSLDPADLIAFLKPRMAHFMVPRYVRIVDDLPKTPTRKVEKYLVRQSGLTPDTWDREAAGISIRREKLAG